MSQNGHNIILKLYQTINTGINRNMYIYISREYPIIKKKKNNNYSLFGDDKHEGKKLCRDKKVNPWSDVTGGKQTG